MVSLTVQYRLLDGFEDPAISPALWNDLLSQGSSDVIFMTWQWQKVWWEVFGRGQLLLVVAEQNGKPIAIAPLFAEDGMIYLVGSGGDYLDFIGDASDPNILEGLLLFAAQQVADFLGFQFFHILEDSQTASSLEVAAKNQGWKFSDEGQWNCPVLELKEFPEQAYQSTRKKSLLRHETFFKRNGNLKIEHLTRSEEVLPHLDAFFEQHTARWNSTKFPSLFLKPQPRLFYRRLTELASETGWLRFTRVVWDDRSIAFHFGFNYKRSFLWYKPSFDITLAKHSPGEVLLRQLLLRAQEENAQIFDFGLGDEAFKNRFATNTRVVKVWGLYKQEPKNVLVISPHPDDESIGCGGTIRKHILDGDTVEVIFLTSGEQGGHGKSQEKIINIREQESLAAAGILQISKINFWREPDGKLQATETNVIRLFEKIKEFQPNVIYVPHENEEHPDHRAAALLARQAIDLLPDTIKPPTVWMFEVWTPLQKMDQITDISPYVDIKRTAISAYKSQCDVVKFDEAILGLNRYRGELYNWHGGDYAEVFQKMS